jgi:hypothetical protein
MVNMFSRRRLGIPEALAKELHVEVSVHDRFVSFGSDNNYYYSRRTTSKGCYTLEISNSHDKDTVAGWIESRKETGDEDIRFVFGPDNTWLACTSRGA